MQDTPRRTWSMRRYNWIGVASVIALVGGFGLWATMTEISGAVIGMGLIEVETKRQIVQHPDGGVVGEILVRDGDLVKAGQVVIRLDDTFARADLLVIESQLFPLLANRGRLAAEQTDAAEVTFDPELVERSLKDASLVGIMKTQVSLFKTRRDNRDKQIGQLREKLGQVKLQIDGLVSRQAGLESQLRLVRSDLEGQRRLLKQSLTQKSRVIQAEREEAQISGNIGETIASIAEARARMAEIEIAILNVSSQLREEAITQLNDTDAKISELRERRASLTERLSRMDILSPADGRVFGSTVHAMRTVIRPAEPIMYIVPEKVKLVLNTQIPPNEIDQVHVGQEADIRFNVFDRRRTPDLHGTVTFVSADIIQNERTGASYFTAIVEPKPGEVETKLKGLVIQPGMPAEAFITTSKRSPWSYLTQPLAIYFEKAFRER